MTGNRIHRETRKRSLMLTLAASAWFAAVPAPAALVDRVLVIRNQSSDISRAVADDYIIRRGATHVLDIEVPDAAATAGNETIGWADFQDSIEKPLRSYLAAHPGIDFILMTKGVPIRIKGAQTLPVSLDSYIAALDYDSLPGAIRIVTSDPAYTGYTGKVDEPYRGLSWANRYWNSRKPFSHAEFGGYLVTRLDGYTLADAIGITTRSLEAETALREGGMPQGQILLDQDPDHGVGDPDQQPYSILRADPPQADTAWIPHESSYRDWNADLVQAADFLRAHRHPCFLDTTESFIGHLGGLMGYASWGSNDHYFQPDLYASLRFSPGGIGETAVSTSARTFFRATGGQSLVATLIESGITGVKGYTDEPLLQAIASPSILFSRYASGWTLAESFYAASNEVGWQDLVIGDPILKAFPFDPEAGFNSEIEELQGPPLGIEPRAFPGGTRAPGHGRQGGPTKLFRLGLGGAEVNALGRFVPGN